MACEQLRGQRDIPSRVSSRLDVDLTEVGLHSTAVSTMCEGHGGRRRVRCKDGWPMTKMHQEPRSTEALISKRDLGAQGTRSHFLAKLNEQASTVLLGSCTSASSSCGWVSHDMPGQRAAR